VPRAIQADRVWVNQYNTYPAYAPFVGVKESGFGRENHKMALDHYRVVKKHDNFFRQRIAWILLIEVQKQFAKLR
jgi:acyl-CoA reductase-like NAD-dependent aldehyde dehydrogenase